MRALLLVAVSALLTGCGTAANYTRSEYEGIAIEEVAMPEDTYRVFDKPAANKMMVTTSIGTAMGQGFAHGLTYGAATGTPKPLFEAAAIRYLEEHGRSGCRIIDAYMLVQTQWEVKYDCTPPAPVASAPRGRRK